MLFLREIHQRQSKPFSAPCLHQDHAKQQMLYFVRIFCAVMQLVQSKGVFFPSQIHGLPEDDAPQTRATQDKYCQFQTKNIIDNL